MKPIIKTISLQALILFGGLYAVLKVMTLLFGFMTPLIVIYMFLLSYLAFIPYVVYRVSKFMELEGIKARVVSASAVTVLYIIFYLIKFIPIIKDMIEHKEPVPSFFHSFAFAFLPAILVSFFFSYAAGAMAAGRRDA